MVTRKPLPSRNYDAPPYPASPTGPSSSTKAPPYPASPLGPPSKSQPSQWDKVTQNTSDSNSNDNPLSLQRTRSSSASSANTWNSGFGDDDEDAVDEHKTEASAIPSSLRINKPAAPANTSAQDATSAQSHNPFFTKTQYGGEDTQAVWKNSAPPPPPLELYPASPPPEAIELPTVRSPTGYLANLSLNEENVESLGPPRIPEKSSRRSLSSQASSTNAPSNNTPSNPWQQDLDREEQRRQAASHSPDVQQPFAQPPPRPDFEPSTQPPPQPRFSPPAPPQSDPPAQLPVQHQLDPPTAPPPAPPALPQFEFESSAQSPAPAAPQPSGHLIDLDTEEAPPAQPPRPSRIEDSLVHDAPAPVESPEEQLKKQRNVTYQIKHINWHDASAGPNAPIRHSPILTQNANGPCPLLALVNALTLSTPESLHTGLLQALRSREQISLGLLLDNVFEELTRRTEITQKDLPDIGDLYSFLITLHTGMNVNPRFVASKLAQRGSLHADPVNLEDMHPGFRHQAKPGTFEETREMLLYSTFDIPLIHGWIPPADSPTYAAFDRSAKTFDEALNIQFAQDDLEQKLSSQGLSPEEQQTFEDVTAVKQFLANYPTQLTEYGLEIMSKSLKSGQVAILFRNDHFSTLYKHPRTGTLMTLVTDAGYSSHDEIVWESLVDVNGAASSLFSGDFRPVGNSPNPNEQDNEQAWQTMPSPSRGSYNPAGASTSGHHSSQPAQEGSHKTLEQEDADLALALQLQEEEEDNQRREHAARRQREDELSRQFLESETTSSQQPPQVPPRRSNLVNQATNANSNSNPDANASTTTPAASEPAPPPADAPYVRPSDGADDSPPSYEQAASDRPFRPPGSIPRQRQGDALGALNALQLRNTAWDQQNSNNNPPAYPPNRRRSSGIGLGGSINTSQRMRRQHSQSQAQASGHNSSTYNPNGQQTIDENRMAEQERCTIM